MREKAGKERLNALACSFSLPSLVSFLPSSLPHALSFLFFLATKLLHSSGLNFTICKMEITPTY